MKKILPIALAFVLMLVFALPALAAPNSNANSNSSSNNGNNNAAKNLTMKISYLEEVTVGEETAVTVEMTSNSGNYKGSLEITGDGIDQTNPFELKNKGTAGYEFTFTFNEPGSYSYIITLSELNGSGKTQESTSETITIVATQTDSGVSELADYWLLDQAIARATDLREEKYTEESWSVRTAAVDAANALGRTLTPADQWRINAAIDAINAAVDALVEVAPGEETTTVYLRILWPWWDGNVIDVTRAVFAITPNTLTVDGNNVYYFDDSTSYNLEMRYFCFKLPIGSYSIKGTCMEGNSVSQIDSTFTIAEPGLEILEVYVTNSIHP
jgi:hypothetical protein